MAVKQKKVKKTTKSPSKTIKRTTHRKVVQKTVKSSTPVTKTVAKIEKKPDRITFVTANVKKIQTAESWKRQKMQDRKRK